MGPPGAISDSFLALFNKLLFPKKKKKKKKADKVALSRRLTSSFFDDNGKFTEEGLRSLPEPLQIQARKISVFHPARYAKRYQRLTTVLRDSTTFRCARQPRVLTIAVGVAGWLPQYTWRNLKYIFNGPNDKDAERKPTRALRIVAQAYAVKAWRAFRNEGN